ncbi:MAG: hypothetical protein R3298_05795 [Gammaproteobacteria bacterium]|nr:hypothetical protein [Gammaproteobacteria bacterium]
MLPGAAPDLPGSRVTARRQHGNAARPALPAWLCLVGALIITTPVVASAPTTEAGKLREIGAPRLALAVVEAEQPDFREDRAGWLAWERTRLDLLLQLGDWPAIEARIGDYPGDLPDPFRDRNRELLTRASLARGDGATARGHLRALLWQNGPLEAARLARWRELLVRSYLADDLVEDAHLAMLRYRQDYGIDDPEVNRLAAGTLLRAGHPAAALALLDGKEDPADHALHLLASLRAGTTPATEVAEAAEKSARGSDDPLAGMRFWAVAAEAAEDDAQRIARLESGLPAADPPPSEAPFRIVPDDLWAAYRAHGETLGNRAQLLVGQDGAWYELATARRDEDPVGSRALFAALARVAREPETRRRAHVAFAEALLELPRGGVLLKRLYLDGHPGADVGELPPRLLRHLAEQAAELGDLDAAARLYTGLEVPPPEADPVDWQVRRARLLLRAGDPAAAGDVLLRLVRRDPRHSLLGVETLLPAVVDLDRAGARAHAATILEVLLAEPQEDPQRHRSLLFALADLRAADAEHVAAARLYLRGAMLPGTAYDDAAGRAARQAAADALDEAGFHDDARALLTALDGTDRNGRRALRATPGRREGGGG